MWFLSKSEFEKTFQISENSKVTTACFTCQGRFSTHPPQCQRWGREDVNSGERWLLYLKTNVPTPQPPNYLFLGLEGTKDRASMWKMLSPPRPTDSFQLKEAALHFYPAGRQAGEESQGEKGRATQLPPAHRLPKPQTITGSPGCGRLHSPQSHLPPGISVYLSAWSIQMTESNTTQFDFRKTHILRPQLTENANPNEMQFPQQHWKGHPQAPRAKESNEISPLCFYVNNSRSKGQRCTGKALLWDGNEAINKNTGEYECAGEALWVVHKFSKRRVNWTFPTTSRTFEGEGLGSKEMHFWKHWLCSELLYLSTEIYKHLQLWDFCFWGRNVTSNFK